MSQTTTLEELETSFPVLPHTRVEATAVLLLVIIWAITWKIRDLTRLPHDHPPLVRSGIPWLGHAIPFLKDNSGFIEQVKTKFPDHGITTLLLAGRHWYLVTDTTLASQIFRQSKNFAFDPLALAVSSAFGCDESDMKIVRRGAHDETLKERSSDVERKEDEPPGILSKLHHMSASHLMGDSLDRMTAVFIDTFSHGIDTQFPVDQESSFEWQELELVDFIKKQWTLASIVSLFGSNILNIWPDVAEWMWEFDTQVQLLMTGLAEWGIFPAAFRAREEALEKFEMWEKKAKTQSQETNLGTDVEWDSSWGLKFLRDRARVAEEYGISARGRAALQLALFWGQNANAIPCASWLTVQALIDPDLFPHLLTEIKTATPSPKNPTRIDIPTLLKQPRLKSLLQEVYRWTTSSPGVRVVQQDTKVGDYLLLKGNIVMIHTRSLQLDPKIWPNAEQFNASRFLEPSSVTTTTSQTPNSNTTNEETKNQKLQSQSMRAFGGGQNLCPGRHFATNEILGGFAVLMNLLEMEVVESVFEARGRPEVEVGDGKQGGLWLDRGVRVKVRRRRAPDVVQ